MSFSFPIRSKQEQAKIAAVNAHNSNMNALRQLQLYNAIQLKLQMLANAPAPAPARVPAPAHVSKQPMRLNKILKHVKRINTN